MTCGKNETYREYLAKFLSGASLPLYRFGEDRLLRQDLLSAEPETAAALEAEVKAVVQPYRCRMVEDRMRVIRP